MSKSCTCKKCVNACKISPGWFAPGEAEKAAELLGMPFKEFRQKYIIIDYWVDGANVYAPRKLGVDEDLDLASYGYGFTEARCTFLDENDRCKIHAAKPMECREAMCCEPTMMEREDIQQLWLDAGAPLGKSGARLFV